MTEPTSSPENSLPEARGIGYWLGFAVGFTARWTLRIVLLFLLLLLVSYFLIQVPAVQRYAAGKAADAISKSLEVEVKVGRIDIEPFTSIRLSDVFIGDRQGDTLILAGSLRAQFFQPIRSLIDRTLYVEALALSDAKLKLYRNDAAPQGNASFLLPSFAPKPQSAFLERDPFQLNLAELTLQNIKLDLSDDFKGIVAVGKLKDLDLELDELNLPDKVIRAQQLAISGIDVDVKRSAPTAFEQVTQDVTPTIAEPLRVVDTTSLPFLTPFFVTLDALDADSISFRYNDARQPAKAKDDFDANHLTITDLELRVKDVLLSPDSLGLQLEGLSLREQSGFELYDMSAGQLAYTRTLFDLQELNIQTTRSRIGDRIQLSLPQGAKWSEVLQKGEFDVSLKPSAVQLGELASFLPALRQHALFRQWSTQKINFSGDFKGSLNSLRARNLSVALPDGTLLRADISARNLQAREELTLSVRVDEAKTSIKKLRTYLPNVKLPTDLDRLGELKFTGRFDGFLNDFVANGDLRTDLGRATLDTRFIAKAGQLPKYSGEAALFDFDLGTYTQNEQLGKLTAQADIRQGLGIRPQDLQLDLIGKISSIEFRNYTYRDIAVNGKLAPTGYEGAVKFADEHADLDFNGKVSLGESVEKFDFTASVRQLDLGPLNLSNTPWSFKGDVELRANTLDLDNLRGTGSVKKFVLEHEDGRRYQIDALSAEQVIAPDGTKRLSLISPIIDLDLSGDYKLLKLPKRLQQAFAKTYPDLYKRSNLPPVGIPDSSVARISLEGSLLDVDSLFRTLNVPVRNLSGSQLALTLDTDTENLDFSFTSAAPSIGGISLINLGLDLRGQSGELDLQARAQKLELGAYSFSGLKVFSEYADGDIRFSVSADTSANVLGDINFAGSVMLADTAVSLSLDPSSYLDIGGERWTVEAGNELVFGKKRIIARDVQLKAGERFIELETLGDKGLNVLLRRFDLDILNAYLNPEKIQVAGEVDLFISAENVYTREGLTLTASVDTFQVNAVDWGALQILVSQPESTDPLSIYTTFSRLGQQAVLDAQFAPTEGIVVNGKARPAQYFDGSLTSTDFDMSFLSYFVPGISDLEGKLGAQLRIHGTPANPIPEGGILIDQCGITVDYLKTRFFVDSQFVSIDQRILDATGRKIRDRFGNTATLTGGLIHENLQKWALDVGLRTDRLEVLHTKKRDNPIFYGDAFASGKIDFTGPFNQTNIVINGGALSGSRIVFPVSGTSADDQLRFIKFRHPEDTVRQEVSTFLRGINLDMTIDVKPQAELLLVFDEAAGDIMRGQGTGTIKIDLQRSGTYSMYGEYQITEGDYLFTLLNVVNKPFRIRPGGTINWDGDPFTAQLNLVAEYQGLSAAPYGLIAEYQQALEARGSGLLDLAYQPTRVNLLMALQGDLQRPDLTFDIELPDLQGDLRNYVNTKIALIRQDENLLNRQVFGLIVIGQFLPELSGLEAQSVGVNTISELFSNQLSYLLTELFTSLSGSGGALSGIDIDINLQNNSSLSGTNARLGNDLQTQLRTYFFDDRLEVGLGAAFGQTVATAGTGTLTAGNFEVAYALTDDRRLRLKTFASTNVDLNNSNRNRAGVGLSWRRQFGSFAELFGFADKARRKEDGPIIFPNAKPQ